jgi:hypothetical protein
MGLYEKSQRSRAEEDAMLNASGSLFEVRFAQEAEKSWKRIIFLAIVAVLLLVLPALGSIVRAVGALFN